ncbi:MAG: proline dehydrogenase family protein [Elusimicrobia bacterium]|nr:proline dehydrogenase family protein [Elusimicrobiota bacterium]
MRLLTFMARRFVAGDNLEEAVVQVKRLNSQGIKATLDNLGEECQSREQAMAARDEYVRMLGRIAEEGLDCNVSLKLTQFGMGLDLGFCRDNLFRVLDEAKKHGNFVRIDMEGTGYTDQTLDLFRQAKARYPKVGIVIQAMLRRSEKDISDLVKEGVCVRLCKGAYKEPPELAFPDKKDVNSSYDRLAELLLQAPNPAYATHDDERIAFAAQAAERAGVAKNRYEIQMLYGLRAKRWKELAAAGHVVRVYTPYGTHWFPYFYRRVRERKENLMFVLRNFFE